MKEKYKRENLEVIIKKSKNWTDVVRLLGLSVHGNSRSTVKKYVKLHKIDISHFETTKERYLRVNKLVGVFRRKDINEILVVNSTYTSTSNLKERLYDYGLKERKCEICGQGEIWDNTKISLILDHINGINNDNRIENLRIVCPNCNAGLPTHCRGFNKIENKKNKYNSKRLKYNINNLTDFEIDKYKSYRKVKNRPSKEVLLNDVKELGYCGTGRKYGVSDNAIRKWLKIYDKYNNKF